MAGEGFSKHASISLRENRSLMRKKRMFKKERVFLNQKSHDIKTHVNQISTKKASKYQLSKIREKIVDEQRKETMVLFVIGLLCFLFTWLIVSNALEFQEERVNTGKTAGKAQISEEKQRKCLYYISSGDEWFGSKKYYNAAFQYRLALKIFPSDTVALKRLVMAYDLNCSINLRNCGKSKEVLASFQSP